MTNDEIKRLFFRHYDYMYRVARSILYDDHECRDVVSDIFESLLCSDMALSADTERAYLLACVRRRCFKRLAHEEVKRRYEAAHFSEHCEEPPGAPDPRLDDVLEVATRCLTPRQLRIFNMRFSEGYTYAEIAQAEGIGKVAVWKHLARILEIIRKHFDSSTQ